MNKYDIKVSRKASKWLKTMPDSVMEYAGEMITILVNRGYFDWEDVKSWDDKELENVLMDHADVSYPAELIRVAEAFVSHWGFYGYRLQSRF